MSDLRRQARRLQGGTSMPNSSATGDVGLPSVALAAKTCQGEGSDQKKHAAGATPVPSFVLVVNGTEGRYEHSTGTGRKIDSGAASKALISETRKSHQKEQ